MVNFITKEFSEADTPVASNEWKNKSPKERVNLISKKINENENYKNFQVIEADENAYITIKIENVIPASVRGTMLLELEESLKNSIEKAITIWLEPVGDKSKLRNLRGIKFKTID